MNLFAGEGEEPLNRGKKMGGGNFVVDVDHGK
jgi:hypothetical protein